MKKIRHYKGYTIEYHHNGVTVSTITDNGYYVHQLYQGYSFRECLALFAEYLKQFENQFIYEEA